MAKKSVKMDSRFTKNKSAVLDELEREKEEARQNMDRDIEDEVDGKTFVRKLLSRSNGIMGLRPVPYTSIVVVHVTFSGLRKARKLPVL